MKQIVLLNVVIASVATSFFVSATPRDVVETTVEAADSLEMSVGLDEISVVARKPLVKSEIDKLSYNVADDDDAATKTAMQMLRKVPMLTVDGQDNIRLKGETNFKIYVNGKPSKMMDSNAKDVLRSMPASSIKSIEVITDPGAKYDAEGVGGIINIVMQGARMEGYNLSLGVTGANTGPSAYAYGSMQVGKFMMSGNYSYNYEKMNDYSTSDYVREDLLDAQVVQTLRNSSRSDHSDSQMHYGSLQGSYEADSLNLVTFNVDFSTWRQNLRGSSAFAMLDAALAPVYSYNTLDRSRTKYNDLSAGADYQHSFRKKDEMLTVSYKFDSSPSSTNTETGYADIEAVPFDLVGRRQDNQMHSTEHTVQVDYVNPLTEHHYIDGGMKFIARKNSSDSKTMVESNGEFATDADQSVNYAQRQNILAAYADYRLKINKFSLKAGVRYEHTFVDVDYDGQPDRNFSKDYDDVVPSVMMSISPTPMSGLRLGYNMRISRPGIWYLNPFRQSVTPNEVSYGNPALSTEKYHNLSLRYNMFSSTVNLNADLSYSFVNNGVTAYSFVDDGVLNRTYGNYLRRQRTSLSVWLNWNITEKTSFMVSAGGSYMDMRSDKLEAKRGGFSGNFYAQVSQQLPWKLNLDVYGGGGTPWLQLEGKSGGFNFYGLTLTRQFLKDDRLEVSLFASDFLDARKKYTSTTSTDTYRMSSTSKTYSLRFGVSVSWRLGSLSASVKRAERSISNDDVMNGGGKQQDGGNNR